MLDLLGTSGCHLCEDAETFVQEVIADRFPGTPWTSVDIASDEALMKTYGVRIPVLRDGTRELDWPFDRQAVFDFLQSASTPHHQERTS